MHWDKLSNKSISNRVFNALGKNKSYKSEPILGVPATYLDQEEFYDDAPFLQDSPFLSTLIANPNHIGCHTVGESEPFFKGTQALEKELIGICAEQIFAGEKDAQDGYVASGGTEANIQAIWIYRNYFQTKFNAKPSEIAVVCSEDSHYSMSKGADLLGLNLLSLKVSEDTREIEYDLFQHQIKKAEKEGVKYFILVMNLATTMFGSVDDVELITNYFEQEKLNFKCHIDGAFGGFVYPFTTENSTFSFQNKHITSFTLDGHKMLQSPYGTGIFLIRKGYMNYVTNNNAQYVAGLDYTICGSRSGANAVVVWMILMAHGSEGWKYKMNTLIDRTDRLCSKLDSKEIEYFRNPNINIVAIKSKFIDTELAKKYNLVPDSHDDKPKWWKIVMMPHVKKGDIDNFLLEI